MQVIIPDINPIRFYRVSELIDHSSQWPSLKNFRPGTKVIEGIYPSKYFQDWVIGKQLSLQLWLTVEGSEDLTVYKFNHTTQAYDSFATITHTAITPTGWVSQKVNRYDYTFSSAGTYYIESSSAGIRTNKFVVHTDAVYRRRVVQISFTNQSNDYGTVFVDGLTNRYTGLFYSTGQFIPDSPGNEISAFATDRQNMIKLRGTPFNVYNLILTNVHISLLPLLNGIFSCDTITVNGVTCQNEEGIEFDRIGKSDIGKADIKLTETNYTYQR
jgi:hypothetical protein